MHERFVFSLSFIYLLNNLLVSVGVHGYLFCTLSYNPIQLYFVSQIAPALATGHSWVDFQVLLTCPHHIFISTLLFSGTTKCSSLIYIYFLPSLTINHLFKVYWFLLLENYLRNQDLDIWYACCYWALLILGDLSWQSRKYVCVH